MEDQALTRKVIGCAYKVHTTLGPGFLEKVYANALCIELEKAGLKVTQQEPVTVYYEGQEVGQYFADLWVESRLIVELKTAEAISRAHELQLVNYLVATGVDLGLLINFGASVEVKSKYRRYLPKRTPPQSNSVNPEKS